MLNQEVYQKEGVEALANYTGPVPGQSLTSNPEERRPFESPPVFTSVHDALLFVTEKVSEEENQVPILKAIDDGVPIVDLAEQILRVGFAQGQWNVDLLLLLAEPVCYVLMALAENSGINYRIDSEDDMMGIQGQEERRAKQEEVKKERIKKMLEEKGLEKKDPKSSLPKEVVEIIDESTPEESLLSPTPLEEEESIEEPNLLDRS